MPAWLRSRSVLSLCSLLALAAGCAGVEPTPGVWEYDETGVSTNTCNYDDVISNGGGLFELIADGDGYMIQPNDGTPPFRCTLEGDALDCPDRAAVEQPIAGLDATLVIAVVARATVESESELSGTQTGEVSCVGSGCATAAAAVGAQLPCQFAVDFQARLQSAD